MGLTPLTCRILRRGDAVPPSTPKRYIDHHGYVILRWKVGPKTYVEVKEHRLVAGLPDEGLHVHHINHVKTDNRPENLQVLSHSEHARAHVFPRWDVAQAALDYASGMGYPEIGRKYGIHGVTAMRALKLRGLQSRPSPGNKTHCNQGHPFTPENTYRWAKRPNTRACRTCARLNASKRHVFSEPRR